jgi:hypothetical protein
MTTATATWPTLAEVQDVERQIAAAYTAIEDLGHFRHLVEALNNPGAPYPTLEEFVALSWFVERVETDLEFIQSYLEPIREARRLGSWGLTLRGDDAR